ncbi:MAG: hypothetical protein WD425_02445 [Nitrospirales bacterium]
MLVKIPEMDYGLRANPGFDHLLRGSTTAVETDRMAGFHHHRNVRWSFLDQAQNAA